MSERSADSLSTRKGSDYNNPVEGETMTPVAREEEEDKGKLLEDQQHVNQGVSSPFGAAYVIGSELVDRAKDAAEQVKQTAKESIDQLKEIVKEGDW